jgi:hypothetical protein
MDLTAQPKINITKIMEFFIARQSTVEKAASLVTMQQCLLHGKQPSNVCCMTSSTAMSAAWQAAQQCLLHDKQPSNVCCMTSSPAMSAAWQAAQQCLLHDKQPSKKKNILCTITSSYGGIKTGNGQF